MIVEIEVGIQWINVLVGKFLSCIVYVQIERLILLYSQQIIQIDKCYLYIFEFCFDLKVNFYMDLMIIIIVQKFKEILIENIFYCVQNINIKVC